MSQGSPPRYIAGSHSNFSLLLNHHQATIRLTVSKMRTPGERKDPRTRARRKAMIILALIWGVGLPVSCQAPHFAPIHPQRRCPQEPDWKYGRRPILLGFAFFSCPASLRSEARSETWCHTLPSRPSTKKSDVIMVNRVSPLSFQSGEAKEPQTTAQAGPSQIRGGAHATSKWRRLLAVEIVSPGSLGKLPSLTGKMAYYIIFPWPTSRTGFSRRSVAGRYCRSRDRIWSRSG